MSGARVFVRLYDGATQTESSGELLMLPPPPLTWHGVLSMMIMAVTKQETEPTPEAVKQARLFLLPTDAQGIVAELNARALRFGVRDNDQFAICLYGEEYKKQEPPVEAVHEEDAAAALTNMSSISTTRLNDYTQGFSNSVGAPTSNGFAPMESNNNGPPRGNIMGMGNGNRKNKRYRSISGKMAAIKSLGDQGLISAEDRGHLKDLLLNNDSPALQEALENYQNTGDFQAVKDLLTKELRNPSAKRPTGDWLPESLINELSENFQTHDENEQEEPDASTSYAGQFGSQMQTTQHMQSHQYMYSTTTPTSGMNHHTSASPSGASDYTTVADAEAVHPMGTTGYADDHQTSWTTTSMHQTSPTNGIYGHQTTMGMQAYATTPQAQINLPLRNRNSVNLLHKTRGMDESQMTPQQQQQHAMMHGNPVEIGYGAHPASYGIAAAQGYAPMGYAPATAGDYSSMTMNGYYAAPMQPQMAYSPYQQPAMAYGMSPYGQGYAQMGYGYYGAGYGYMKAGQMGRMGGKWTTAPPMPAYPPACSPEEKKEKIARWLKKRENRNWSNKPSYPVRHNIAKNRKRGEDGRFITKKRLAEMEREEAERAAAGLPPREGGEGTQTFEAELDQDEASGSDPETSAMQLGVLDTNVFARLPAPLHT